MNFKQKLAYTGLGGILVFMGLLLSHTVSRDVTAQSIATFTPQEIGQTDPPANIMVSEYLHLFFTLQLGRTRLLNFPVSGFQLIQPYVYFNHPSDLSQGIVYLVCLFSDEPFSQLALRREIRRFASSTVRGFEALSQWPEVSSRWSPSQPLAHFVIRHVRHSDTEETLAVTLDGVTYFDAVKFWEAEQRVENSGGNWAAVKD